MLTKIDGKLRPFIVREDVNAIAVPFGAFADEKRKSPFDYIIENKSFKNGDKNIVFSHYHMRSPSKANTYMDEKELKETARYFVNAKNSNKMTDNILNFVAKDTSKSYYELAGEWSGSKGEYNFSGEIMAHADLLDNRNLMTNIIKNQVQKNITSKSTDKSYYDGLGIADLAKGDSGSDKKKMDLIWGSKSLHTKILDEYYKNGERD